MRFGLIYAMIMNKVAGASSADEGMSWSKNRIIYKSPDSTVRECCKPSVQMKDQLVVFMFRNWVDGNRDLYIMKSSDGGLRFNQEQKLKSGNWKLNACLMDGRGLVINPDNSIFTVWYRQEIIYGCEASQEESIVAKGKQPTIAGNSNKYFISYVNEGNVYCRMPDGNIVNLGQGRYPNLKLQDEGSSICAWEMAGKTYCTVLSR